MISDGRFVSEVDLNHCVSSRVRVPLTSDKQKEVGLPDAIPKRRLKEVEKGTADHVADVDDAKEDVDGA